MFQYSYVGLSRVCSGYVLLRHHFRVILWWFVNILNIVLLLSYVRGSLFIHPIQSYIFVGRKHLVQLESRKGKKENKIRVWSHARYLSSPSMLSSFFYFILFLIIIMLACSLCSVGNNPSPLPLYLPPTYMYIPLSSPKTMLT